MRKSLSAMGCGLFLLLWGPGCSNPTPRPTSSTPVTPTARLPVLLGDTAVSWDSLHPYLTELAGRGALEEAILDHELARRMRVRGLALSEQILRRERELLFSSVTEGEDGIDIIRARRGLGPVRFDRMIQRNASLRALTGSPPILAPDEIRHAYELRHGERRVVRVLLTPNATLATRVRDSLASRKPGDDLEWAFATAAFEHSTDPSGANGGLLGAVHPLDQSLPVAVRQSLISTRDGMLSQVVLTETEAVLVLPLRTTPASGVSFEEAIPELTLELTTQRQRLMMDDLARSILAQARPTVLDPGLNWSWNNPPRDR